MLSLLPTYEMSLNPPSAEPFDRYASRISKQYSKMLADASLKEDDYQRFFESNPCMLPGFNYGNPSHGAAFHAAVSQPAFDGPIRRRPDFMWLLETSLELIPVFIEIECPSKDMFRSSDNVQNAKFTQACEQIDEWRALLQNHEAVERFYNRYAVSDRMRSMKFSPHYILVYGRRREYSIDSFLTGKRAAKQTDDFEIISFDRLKPSYDAMRYGTVKVRPNGSVHTVAVPPTFQLGPSIAGYTSCWQDFDAAVDSMEAASEERKAFLKTRYRYWCDWKSQSVNTVYETGKWE